MNLGCLLGGPARIRVARTATASSLTPARITASELRPYPSNSMDESSRGSR